MRKLTTIIVVSFVATLALVLTIVTVVSYRIFFDFTSGEISETRLALLNENTDKLSNTSQNVVEAGRYLAANRTVQQIFSQPVTDAFDAVNEQRQLGKQMNIMAGLKPEIHSLEMYTDRYRGFTYIRGSSVFPLEELRNQPWFAYLEQVDSGWVPREKNGQRIVSYVHRLVDERGHKVGYVIANMFEPTFFADLTLRDQVDASSERLIIVDSGGRVIARTEAANHEELFQHLTVYEQNEPFAVLHGDYLPFANHHQVVHDGHQRHLLLISKHNHERWRLIQLIPVEPLYAETIKLGWIVLLVGFLVLLLSIPLVYWVGKRVILTPIGKLIRGMRQVERGKFDVALDPLYIEEFDYLAQHFNHMTRELEESIQRINSEHRARRDAELKMLQSQIMPHFLYNTLDIIHWKAMDYQAEDISLMVNALSKMFRIGLSGGRSFIRLRDELEHVNQYMQIQRARMSDRQIEYTLKVPAFLKDYYVPKVILQPFIENSMKHGYRDKPTEVIRLGVTVKQEQEHLLITIVDEGVGLPEDWRIETSTGIGVRNVQERIWMYCGRPYGIELVNRPEGGTAVVIMLPILRSQQEVDACIEKNSAGLDRM